MRCRHAFQTIGCGTPMFDAAGLTPNAGAHQSGGGFALATWAAQVNSAAFSPDKPQEDGSKAHITCQQEAAVPDTQGRDLLPPYLQRARLSVALGRVL